MSRLAGLCAFTLAAALTVALTVSGGTRGRAATDCIPRHSSAGSETPGQHDGQTLMQIPVAQAMGVDRLVVSTSFAAHTAGYGEELLLAGVADGPIPAGSLPPTSPDPGFGTVSVGTSPAVAHNENPAMTGPVLLSRIVKATQGSASALADQPYTPPLQLSPGQVLWVFYASVSTSPLDPEVQVQITWRPQGCAA